MMVNVSGKVPDGLDEARIRRAVREAFRTARRVPRGSVAVRFVREAEMASLNRSYGGKAGPTDVLSFSSATSPEGEKEWGDVVIATTYVKRQAKDRGIPFAEEAVRLIIHGTLHLLGFDHRTKREEADMFGKQERAVARLKGTGTYAKAFVS